MSHPAYPGSPSPPGATWNGKGANFAVYAEGIAFCLYHKHAPQPATGWVRTRETSDHIWHGCLLNLRPGQYGYRGAPGVYNLPSEPFDQYITAIAGIIHWSWSSRESITGRGTEDTRKGSPNAIGTSEANRVRVLGTHKNFVSEPGLVYMPGQSIKVKSWPVVLLKHPKYKTINARRFQSA